MFTDYDDLRMIYGVYPSNVELEEEQVRQIIRLLLSPV